MISNKSIANYSNNPSSVLSKAETERRRRARINVALSQMKMFHLMRSPNIGSKMEKIEVMEMTIKYLKLIGNYQRKEAEKTAYLGYTQGFQAAQQASTSYIYSWYDSSTSSALVATVNALLASEFDKTYKSFHWLKTIYGKTDEERKTTLECTPKSDLTQHKEPANFAPQLHSTPINRRFGNIPPLFESPESVRDSQLSLSPSVMPKNTTQLHNETTDSDKNDHCASDFICVTCDDNCQCNNSFRSINSQNY